MHDVFSKLSGPIPLLPIAPWSNRCASRKKREKDRERERDREEKKLITRTSESVSENKRVFLIRHLDKYKAFVTRVSESSYSFLLFSQPSIVSLPLPFFPFCFNYAALVERDWREKERRKEKKMNIGIRTERIRCSSNFFSHFYFIFKIFHCASKKEIVRRNFQSPHSEIIGTNVQCVRLQDKYSICKCLYIVFAQFIRLSFLSKRK